MKPTAAPTAAHCSTGASWAASTTPHHPTWQAVVLVLVLALVLALVLVLVLVLERLQASELQRVRSRCEHRSLPRAWSANCTSNGCNNGGPRPQGTARAPQELAVTSRAVPSHRYVWLVSLLLHGGCSVVGCSLPMRGPWWYVVVPLQLLKKVMLRDREVG